LFEGKNIEKEFFTFKFLRIPNIKNIFYFIYAIFNFLYEFLYFIFIEIGKNVCIYILKSYEDIFDGFLNSSNHVSI
jgi:hypothetical protein